MKRMCIHMAASGLTPYGKWCKMEANYAGKKTHPTTGLCTRRLGFAPDDWALHPTTGLCTRLLGFAPDYWALHPTTGLCTRLLGFAPDYWALQPTTGLFTRLLSSSPDCWASNKIMSFFTYQSSYRNQLEQAMFYIPLTSFTYPTFVTYPTKFSM